MSRVQIPFSFSYPATVSGATVLEPVVGTSVAVTNRDTGLPATVWQAEVGASTYSSIVTDSGGNVPGWLDPGSYKLQAAAQGAFTGAVINFEAVRGDGVTNIAPGAVGTNQILPGSITLELLAAAVAQALVPTGTVLDYVGLVAPAGYHFCNGAVRSQTDPIFAPLFGVIGTSYNTGGEAAGNFRLPNTMGRFALGAGNGLPGYTTPGNTGGSLGHTHTLSGGVTVNLGGQSITIDDHFHTVGGSAFTCGLSGNGGAQVRALGALGTTLYVTSGANGPLFNTTGYAFVISGNAGDSGTSAKGFLNSYGLIGRTDGNTQFNTLGVSDRGGSINGGQTAGGSINGGQHSGLADPAYIVFNRIVKL